MFVAMFMGSVFTPKSIHWIDPVWPVEQAVSYNYAISHHKSHSFCTRLYHVAIETVMHIKYDTCNKVTFVLSSDS